MKGSGSLKQEPNLT